MLFCHVHAVNARRDSVFELQLHVLGNVYCPPRGCARRYKHNKTHLKAPLAATLTVLALISVPLPWQPNSTWHTGEPACEEPTPIRELSLRPARLTLDSRPGAGVQLTLLQRQWSLCGPLPP